jgi:kynurenine formamidase
MKRGLLLLTGVVLLGLIFFLQAFEWKEKARQRKFVDVSHEIEDGMITYKGIPAPVISAHLTREASAERYSDGVQFLISKIDMVANTGTYIDAPFHRYENGEDLASLDLAKLAYVDAVVVKVDGEKVKHIDESFFKNVAVKGKAILIHTNWSKRWRTDSYFENHPHLTRGAAQFLADAGAKIVGIDSYNIDDTQDKSRPAHSILLAKGIPIVEHLCNLDNVPATERIEFNAVPVKIKNFSTFPLRAFVTW